MVQFQFPSHHFPGSIPASAGDVKRQHIPDVMAIAMRIPFRIIIRGRRLPQITLARASYWPARRNKKYNSH
jgi:hypothetical protein